MISETVPCDTCKEPTTFTGTKRCNNCYEVEGRLSTYLRSARGRSLVRARLAMASRDARKTKRGRK